MNDMTHQEAEDLVAEYPALAGAIEALHAYAARVVRLLEPEPRLLLANAPRRTSTRKGMIMATRKQLLSPRNSGDSLRFGSHHGGPEIG